MLKTLKSMYQAARGYTANFIGKYSIARIDELETFIYDLVDENRELKEKLTGLESRLAALEEKVECKYPTFAGVENLLSKHPTRVEIEDILSQYATNDELAEVRELALENSAEVAVDSLRDDLIDWCGDYIDDKVTETIDDSDIVKKDDLNNLVCDDDLDGLIDDWLANNQDEVTETVMDIIFSRFNK